MTNSTMFTIQTMPRAHFETPTRRAIVAAALLFTAMEPATAQREIQRGTRAEKPTGAEIALKARSARLDRANAGKGEFQGKPITFTPAVLPPRVDLAGGQVIGILENEVEGDETGLPPGKYNVFAARLADGWHVYAEAGGEIVREALRVELVRRPGQPADRKPRIRPKGWGVDIDYTPERTLNPPPVASIAIVGDQKQLVIGEQRQFTIELKDASGNLLAGRTVSWTSSTPGVASAPSKGLALGVTGGTATFTATSEGKSASITLQVPPLVHQIWAYPTNGAVSPPTSSVPLGERSTLTTYVSVQPCYYNSCPAQNPAEITMSNSAPAIATVARGTSSASSGSGYAQWMVTPLQEGTTDLTFGYRGVTSVVRLTVTRARATSISISPTSPSVIAGQTVQLTATARNASGAVISAPAYWRSSAPSIADVTQSGRVAGVAPGVADITASLDTVSQRVQVRVTPVPVATVAVAPTPVTVVENGWTALTATPRDQAGNTLTRYVWWTVNNTAIAEVTSSGRVVGVAPGTAIVTAWSEGKSGSATVTVTAADAETTERPTETISFNW
jgi:uncharacterized protein YjdB